MNTYIKPLHCTFSVSYNFVNYTLGKLKTNFLVKAVSSLIFLTLFSIFFTLRLILICIHVA